MDRRVWDYVVTWWRIAFAIHLLYSGLAYAITGWVPTDMAVGNAGAGEFLIALNGTGLYVLVKYFEIVIGTMLLLNIAVPLVLVVHLPITMMIAYLNLVVQPHGRELYTGPQELAMHIPLLFAYGGYYTGFLKIKTQPWWLWDNLPATRLDPPAGEREEADSGRRGLWLAFAIVAVAIITILLASYTLSQPDRKLAVRDWLPTIFASVGMIGMIMRDRLKKG